VIIGLFEATKTTRQALAKSLTKLLDKYGLREKNIAYVKDEGSNLNAMIGVLKFVVNCESFGLKKNFQVICFGHAFSKTCQHGIEEETICKKLNYVSIKSTQSYLQKCITWLKFGKGIHEWNKTCLEIGIRPKKLNTLIKTR